MRRYLVAPHGSVLLEVSASSPHTALRKAERGHAEPVDIDGGLTVAASRATRLAKGQDPIPGQFDLYATEEAA